MRKFILVMLGILLGIVIPADAKRKTINGVQYETSEDNTATATLTVMARGEVTVLETIEIGKQRFLVVQLNEAFFKKNDRITSVLLPKSIKTIKDGALRGCSELARLQLPTDDYIIEDGAFAGCEKIAEITGNTFPYFNCRGFNDGDTESLSQAKNETPLFSTFAEKTLKERMQFWQTKKNYESIEQYKARVTEENRRKKMDEFEEESKKEYVARYKPSKISTNIGVYDSEYGVFTIPTLLYGELYAQVPKEDAQAFRQNYYDKVEVLPQFGVVSDTLAIVSCQFRLNGKYYSTTTNYAKQGGVDHNFELPPLDINLAVAESAKAANTPVTIDNAVDKNIPKSKQQNQKMFAVIIGNEKYTRVAQVPFANNDAKVFAEYCKKTLGIPANNVKLYQNAGLNDMRHAVTALVNTLKAYDGEAQAIVYYAGHGIPDEKSRMPYLLPTDGFATDIRSGYNLSDLYDELAAAPSKMTVVLLDACFSGAKREGDMLAEARAVAIEARSTMPTGNLLVFSAAQGNETVYSDKRHGHGMFTYYLLKHLQDTAGDTTMSSLTDYVITNVKRSSVSENDGKMQTPTIMPSSSLMSTWQELRLK